MPLNKTEGEMIPGIWPDPADYQVVPVQNWATRPEFEDACRFAAGQLALAGAERPIKFSTDDVIAQTYPRAGDPRQIAFIFCKPCRGGLARDDVKAQERFSVYKFAMIRATNEGGKA